MRTGALSGSTLQFGETNVAESHQKDIRFCVFYNANSKTALVFSIFFLLL